ncbi:MAG: hypothetical protein NVS3B29_07850 [Candidatus Saccharimonadales bacterium]
MASNELTPEQQSQIADTLSQMIESGGASEALPGPFSPRRAAQKDAEGIINDLLVQKPDQRDKLLKFISQMTIASFSLLAVVVLMQMIVRLFIPKYSGVSDFVVNVITVSAFGEIIAIVASISLAVWKDPDRGEK